MRARWVREGPPSTSHIGFAVVARWFPGKYYLVSTVCSDGTSPLARLTKSMETGISFNEIASAPPMFVTNIFDCDRHGFARRIDKPLHERVYSTLEDARVGHSQIVDLLVNGKLKFAPPNRL